MPFSFVILLHGTPCQQTQATKSSRGKNVNFSTTTIAKTNARYTTSLRSGLLQLENKVGSRLVTDPE